MARRAEIEQGNAWQGNKSRTWGKVHAVLHEGRALWTESREWLQLSIVMGFIDRKTCGSASPSCSLS